MTAILEPIAEPTTKPSFASLLSPVQGSFTELSQQQAEQAKDNLQQYMRHNVPGSNLGAELSTIKDYTDQTLSLRLAFHGNATPENAATLEKQMTDALSAHPILITENMNVQPEQGADGKVSLTGTISGLTTQHYAELIHALAEQQHAQDTFETTNGFAPEDSHHIHDKLQSAVASLKELIKSDQANSDLPAFNLKMEVFRSEQNPNNYRLDLRIDGVERTQYGPIRGALIKAFNRKRRNGMVNNNGLQADELNDYSIDGLTLGLDDISFEHLHDLLDKMAAPLSNLVPQSIFHLGKVQEQSPEQDAARSN